MNDKDKLRIGDSDRELVSRLLKQAVDEGRLTLPEYDMRLQQVYEAKTVGDLDPITGDLMGSGTGVLAVTEDGDLSTVGEAPRRRKQRRDVTPAWIKWMWFGWLVPVTVCTTIWGIGVFTGVGDQGFWPLWVAGSIGAPMACVTFMERFMIRPALIERDQQRPAGDLAPQPFVRSAAKSPESAPGDVVAGSRIQRGTTPAPPCRALPRRESQGVSTTHPY